MDSAIDITYEPVDLFGNLLCKIFIYSCSQEELPFHWHNCYEFSCCFVDDSTLIINGEKHVIKAGQLSFVNANIIHCPLPHKMKTIRGITVLIPVDVAKSYFPTYEETSFQIEDNVFVQKMILKDLIEMYTLSLEPTKTAPLRINSLVLDILAIMFDYSQECPDCVENKNALPKKQYAEYILRNYKKNLTLNEVAQYYGYSKVPAFVIHHFHRVLQFFHLPLHDSPLMLKQGKAKIYRIIALRRHFDILPDVFNGHSGFLHAADPPQLCHFPHRVNHPEIPSFFKNLLT